MKIDEVPQDKGYLIEGKVSDLTYAVDKDGKYTSKQSKGWKPKNDAMTLAWDQVYERAEKVRNDILEGVRSPLAFYMELNVMDVRILSDYTGIPKWRVKRHLKMKHFNKLKPEVIAKYAEAMDMTPTDLKDLEKIFQMEFKHED